MARTNIKPRIEAHTHEGGKAVAGLKPIEQLARSVMACFLWEDTFYEDGVAIAERIRKTAELCDSEDVARLAIHARTEGKLRHVPLLLLEVLTRTGKGRHGFVAGVIENVIQRADEIAEFLSIYHAMGAKTELAQVKKGLARAFQKFDAYQLAKCDRDGKFRLRDALFLAHAKPAFGQLAPPPSNVVTLTDFASKSRKGLKRNVWRHDGNILGLLKDGKLPAPDTWEVNLTRGADKKETFERLLREKRLGYVAVLRNLRGMQEAGVDVDLIKDAIRTHKGRTKVLPFRYIAAVNAAPAFADALGDALLAALEDLPKLPGRTIVMVDTSGSMQSPVSGKSTIARVDAAAVLASMVRGELRLFQFADTVRELAFYPGLAGVEHVRSNIGKVGYGTEVGRAVAHANTIPHDRLIVITDEQTRDRVQVPAAKHAYLINTACYQNGVGYRNGWTHIDGFSEATIKYIHAVENDSLDASDTGDGDSSPGE